MLRMFRHHILRHSHFLKAFFQYRRFWNDSIFWCGHPFSRIGMHFSTIQKSDKYFCQSRVELCSGTPNEFSPNLLICQTFPLNSIWSHGIITVHKAKNHGNNHRKGNKDEFICFFQIPYFHLSIRTSATQWVFCIHLKNYYTPYRDQPTIRVNGKKWWKSCRERFINRSALLFSFLVVHQHDLKHLS